MRTSTSKTHPVLGTVILVLLILISSVCANVITTEPKEPLFLQKTQAFLTSLADGAANFSSKFLYLEEISSILKARDAAKKQSQDNSNMHSGEFTLPHQPFQTTLNEENSMFQLSTITFRSFAISMSRNLLYSLPFAKDKISYFEQYLDLLVAHYIRDFKKSPSSSSSSSSIYAPLSVQQSSSSSGSFAPTHKYPADLTDTSGWGGYGIYLALMFLIPIIIGLLAWTIMSCFFCCRLCGLCGGDKPVTEDYQQKGFTKTERRLMLIPYCILFILIIIVVIIAIIFSILFSVAVRTVVNNTFSLADQTEAKINDAGTFLSFAKSEFNNAVDSAAATVSYASQIADPITNIVGIVQGTSNTVNTIGAYSDQISSNVSSIKSLISSIAATADFSVPNMNAIPDNSQLAPFINTAQSALSSLTSGLSTTRTSILDSINLIPSSILTAKSSVNSQLDNLDNQVNSTLSGFKKTADPYIGKPKRDEVQYYTFIAENVRLSVVLVFIVLVSLAFLLGALGFLCKNGICFRIMACYSCSFSFLYFILCAIQLVIFLGIYDLCNEAPSIPPKADNLYVKLTESQLPTIMNTTISVTNITNLVYNCAGNTTYLDAAGVGKDTLNINGISSSFRTQLTSRLNEFNIDSQLATYRNELTNYTSNFINYDITPLLSNITSYETQLDTILNQANDLSRFNFSQAQYQGSLDQVNNLTLRAGVSVTFTNITNLNVNDPRLQAVLSPSEIQTLNNTKNQVVALQIQYNNTISKIVTIQNQVAQIRVHFGNIKVLVNRTVDTLATVKTTPTLIGDQLDLIGVKVNQVKVNVTSVYDLSVGAVNSVVDKGVSLFKCDNVGSYSRSTANEVCVNIKAEMLILCLCCGFIGLLMFAYFPVLCVAAKRQGYSEENVAGDSASPPADI